MTLAPLLMLVRLLPLVGVGVGVLAIVPADLRAGSAAVTTGASASIPRARVKVSVPSPRIIQPALLSSVAAQPSVAAEVRVTDMSSSPTDSVTDTSVSTGQEAYSPPAGLRSIRVGSSAVNVHSNSMKGTTVLFALAASSIVRAGETVNGWVHVYADQGDGWVYGTYLNDGSVAPTPDVKVASRGADSLLGKVVQLKSATRVFDQPDGTPVYTLDAGERMRIAGGQGSWVRIITDTNESGWIRL